MTRRSRRRWARTWPPSRRAGWPSSAHAAAAAVRAAAGAARPAARGLDGPGPIGRRGSGAARAGSGGRDPVRGTSSLPRRPRRRRAIRGSTPGPTRRRRSVAGGDVAPCWSRSWCSSSSAWPPSGSSPHAAAGRRRDRARGPHPGHPELAGHAGSRPARAGLPGRRPARIRGPAHPDHEPGADAAGRRPRSTCRRSRRASSSRSSTCGRAIQDLEDAGRGRDRRHPASSTTQLAAGAGRRRAGRPRRARASSSSSRTPGSPCPRTPTSATTSSRARTCSRSSRSCGWPAPRRGRQRRTGHGGDGDRGHRRLGAGQLRLPRAALPGRGDRTRRHVRPADPVRRASWTSSATRAETFGIGVELRRRWTRSTCPAYAGSVTLRYGHVDPSRSRRRPSAPVAAAPGAP